MEISTTMLPDGNLMTFGRDITERKKLEDEQKKNHEELAANYRLSNSINKANSLDEIFREAINSVQNTIRVDGTAILLFDPDGVMRFKATQDLTEEYKQVMEGQSPWSKESTGPDAIFIRNVEQDSSVEQWRPALKKEGIGAIGFIPIIQDGKLLGNIHVVF